MSEGGAVLEDTDHTVESRPTGQLLGHCLMEGWEIVVYYILIPFLALLGVCVALSGLDILCIVLACEFVREMCLSYFLPAQYAN